jgi:hypothetical protein
MTPVLDFELTKPNLPLGSQATERKRADGLLIRESEELRRKSEQLNAGIEKLRSKIKKLQ